MQWHHFADADASSLYNGAVDEADLYTLIEGAGDAAFVVDQFGVICYWSRKAEEMLGFRREQVLQKSCAEVMAGVDEAGAPVCCR